MTDVTSPRDLFLHELQDMYYAEKTLAAALPKLADEARDRELARAFKSHHKETKQQAANLERVFRELGEKAEGQPCPGIEGIKQEHDDFVSENGKSGMVLELFLTGAGARAEHYEIAGYTGLVTQARALGERGAVKLLQENLRQEKEALKTLESISKRLAQKASNGRASRSKRSTASRSKSRS